MLRYVIAAAICCCCAGAQDGFKSLFDGKTLNGWKLVQSRGPGWTAENGMIVCPQGGGGKLMTTEEYGDFVLQLEYRVTASGNNGVNIRAPYEGRPAYVGMEIQILDDGSEKWRNVRSEQKTGSVYDLIPARTGFAKPPGEWNQMEITAKGRQITVVLNGVIVTDVNLDIIREPALLEKHPGVRRSSGHLGLLGHSTRTEFRNLRVKKL